MAYTTIDDGTANFQTATYSGTGNVGLVITNTGYSDLQPDLIWWKNRTNANDNRMTDSSRGANKYIAVNLDSAEGTSTTYVTSFNSDGYTVSHGDGSVNAASYVYVGWQWKLNGGTTTTNNDGNRSVTLQANADAGISLMLYEGSGADGATYGHGLGAVPDMVIIKNRDSGNYSWAVWHSSISPTYGINMDSAGVQYSAGSGKYQTFTSSVIALESWSGVNVAESFMAIAMTGIKGYSKFGTYIGNGNAAGTFIYTGFKPAMVIMKNTADNTGWYMIDTTRDTYNPCRKNLQADSTATEGTGISMAIDLLSNGFKQRSTTTTTSNRDTHKYIYAAWAENPFVTSGGVPATAG